MPTTPKLRANPGIIVDTRAARDAVRTECNRRAFDIFMRTTAVAADPDGEGIWLLVKPKGE